MESAKTGEFSRVSRMASAQTGGLPRLQKLESEKPARNRYMPVKSNKGDLQTTKARRPQNDAAMPHAFKQHDAVNETGARSRHSKAKTLLIVVPIVVVLIAAVALGIFLISPLFEKKEIEAGVAVTVVIPSDVTTASQIASILKDANIISDTTAFIAECVSLHAEGLLKSGTYELETLMDMRTLIDYLVAGPIADGSRLIIPEGLTVEQTAKLVESSCGIKEADFLARAYAADSYVSQYPFLQEVHNNSLEGFLFPKTYVVPNGSNADFVVRMLLDQFALEIKKVDLTYAEDHGMNLYWVVVLGSLIERETYAEEERPLVSSVIYNRMREGMKLQIDATVVYALGPNYDGHPLLNEDLEIDSPYNTYMVYELPAGPICSPGISSIKAAANPARTDYYYYVLSSREGYHTFCETEDEFWLAKDEYNTTFGLQ